MTDTKFTPGPWVLRNYYVGVADDSDTQSCGMLLLIAAIDRFDFEPQWKANAQLIAAAPELYEALTRCKFDSLNMTVADLEFCKAAMAKARGDKS